MSKKHKHKHARHASKHAHALASGGAGVSMQSAPGASGEASARAGLANGLTPALEAAAMRRRLSMWLPASQHVNAAIYNAGDTVLSRARWLVRNNGYARSAVRSWSAAVVGPGIKPNSVVEDTTLRDIINETWLRWTDQADSEDVTDFYGLTRRVTREAFLAGETFVRFRPTFPQTTGAMRVPLQLQMLPSEQLAMEQSLEVFSENGNDIRMGIEFDRASSERLAYYFWRANPVDTTLTFREALMTNELTRVPADEVVHVYDPVEAGQIRGLTGMAAAIVRLFMLDSFDDATLERQRQAARFATFIRRPDFRMDTGMPFTDESAAGYDESLAPRPGGGLCEGDQFMPGATVVLYPGEDVEFAHPPDVGNNFESFQYRTLLQICAALGIPYTELSSDLNRTTYASSRAGLVAFRQEVEAFQHSVIVYQFLRRVWNRWFDSAVLSGALPISPTAYMRSPDTFRAMEAITPRAPWVDPLKDRQAVVLALRSGMMSPQQACAAEGYDLEDVYNQIAEANVMAKALGITIDYGWSARATQGPDAAPTTPQPVQPARERTPPNQQRGAA